MAPPTRAELANREQMIRQALARLDPQGLTPAALREVIVEVGIHHRETGGAIVQASIAMPMPAIPAGRGQQPQGQQGQVRGRGRGRGRGQGRGHVAGSVRGGGSSGQQ